MKQQKIALILIWIGVVGLLYNFIMQWITSPVFKANSPEELAETIWATDGILFMFNGIITAIGFGFSIIGILLYSATKGSLFWLWGFAPFVAFGLLNLWHQSINFSPLFGIGGGLITLAYFGVLWSWVKTHSAYEGNAKTGKHIQLLGYSFFYISAIFLCIHLGTPKHPAIANMPVVGGESIIIAFTVGFVLISIGQYITGQQFSSEAS